MTYAPDERMRQLGVKKMVYMGNGSRLTQYDTQ